MAGKARVSPFQSLGNSMEGSLYYETALTLPRKFFDSAYQHYTTSASQAGEIKRYYRIARFTLCIVFAGPALIETLTAALKHLQIEPLGHCDLTICVWDSESTGMPTVDFPWSHEDTKIRGEVFGYNSDENYTVVDVHTKVLHLFDKKQNIALYWVKDGASLPWWISGSPFQLIIHWWMRELGLQLTHAAAVGYPQGGVLLAGKSGSGKSTTSLACMKAGMQYISEDYCLVSDLPDIWAYSVYNSAKIEEKTLSWFPELKQQIENLGQTKEEKAFLFHQKFQPEKILYGCPLKAVITLKIESEIESWLEPIAPAAAISALSVSTMWQLTHTGPIVFKHLKKITEALPCYQLHLGSNLAKAPELIGKLL